MMSLGDAGSQGCVEKIRVPKRQRAVGDTKAGRPTAELRFEEMGASGTVSTPEDQEDRADDAQRRRKKVKDLP